MPSRLYYAEPEGTVVLSKNGQEVLRYPSVEALIETHIKGLIAQASEDQNPSLLSRLEILYRQSTQTLSTN